MKTLPCHSHTNLAWYRGRTEAGLILAILEHEREHKPTVHQVDGYLANEDRATEQELFRKLPNRTLSIFRGGKLYDAEAASDWTNNSIQGLNSPAALRNTAGRHEYFGEQHLTS